MTLPYVRPFHTMMMRAGEHLQQAAVTLAFAEKPVIDMAHDELLACIGMLHKAAMREGPHGPDGIFITVDLPRVAEDDPTAEDVS
jgi:hypothetical protein